MSLYAELKRRNVFRVATAYVAVSWLLIQVLDTLLPIFGASEAAARIIVILLVIGFLPALVFAWVFELTPDGLKREGAVDHDAPANRNSAKSLDRVIMTVLTLAVIYFAFDKFVIDPTRDIQIAQEASEQARDKALVSSYGEHSIAVMPFSDLSSAKDQEYFSDGIAEEIINLLSRVRNLRVIARSSAFSFKGQNLAASVIGARLDVRYIMEGSIRRSGERLRITATVIDASTDTQLWSENFDRDFGDIFAIQDEIAGEVVDRLEMQISGKLPSTERVDPESYALYLQARHQRGKHNKDGVVEADRLLTRALEIDPTNVAGWLLVLSVTRSMDYWGVLTKEQAITRSKEAVARALELDPGNPVAKVSSRFLEQDVLDTWEGELDAATFAMQLLPTSVEANATAADVLSGLGQFDRSLEYTTYVLGKDPLCAGCLRTGMMTLMTKGDYAAAEDMAKRYIDVTGGAGVYTLGFIQLLQGDAETALETMEASDTIPFVNMQGRVIANWTLGRAEQSEKALAELEATVGDEKFAKLLVRPEDYLAGTYAWIGRRSEALDILERFVDPPGSWGPQRWSVDPVFNSLHDDPRWLALLEREKITPQHIESYQLDKRFPGPGQVPVI